MPQYDYERFTPDRFQEFCQALLVRQYPDAQCYPVGQKDGGRDALSGGIVFQVKFKRERLQGDDGFRILRDALSDEVEKVKKLAARGATHYVIMTNLVGTSALDNGQRDKIQKYLDDELPIPGQVWWRPELDARLNNAYELKWIFSEILTSGDMLQMLIEEGLGENARRRMLAVNGYLTAQFDADEYVKFKQADLQASDLLSLFVDVPVMPRAVPKKGRNKMNSLERLFLTVMQDEPSTAQDQGNRLQVGGATLLCHSATQDHLPRVVLEGAPGQGKSTLAQYVCQVQRMRFLDKQKLSKVPAKHRLVPAKVPFKVDLRDLASWLRRVDPITEQPLADDVVASLEAFLAAQVRHASGGQSFTVDDLSLFLSKTPALIFLDGLDEVATMPERRAVIDAVSTASARLHELSPFSQMVVTSRPAAVVNTPAFDQEHWEYLHLQDITETLIFDYTERWSAARRISKVDTDEIKRILKDKLASPHVKDLARNAMQLTILLNLVQARGQALPDQRTELYDQYVDVFFNREAEKNRVVLENRQLLIDLHGFLAWRMHSNAESRRSNGRISEDALRDLLQEYLLKHEYDLDVVDDLLAGVVQRIVALVSRVEGTFEFEVQPLREYFTARHLYNTAPYSPVGRPQSGTKPEIFSAIAPNPYWLNVTRFFSGCYSVGELSGLADQLEELLDGPGGLTSFPRVVASSLLVDRVFHQAPKVSKRVASLAVDTLTLRYAFEGWYFDRGALPIELSGAGQQAAAERALTISLSSPIAAIRRESAYSLSYHVSESLRSEVWIAARPELVAGPALLRWLESGFYARLVKNLDDATALVLRRMGDEYWELLVQGGHRSVLDDASQAIELVKQALDGKLDLDGLNSLGRQAGVLFHPFHYELLLRRDNTHFANALISTGSMESPMADLRTELGSLIERAGNDFSSSRVPWDSLFQTFDEHCGRSWMVWRLASTAASANLTDLEESSEQLCHFACSSPLDLAATAQRMRSDVKWWKELAEKADSALCQRVWLLFLTKFANPLVLRECLGLADEFCDKLSAVEFGLLYDAVERQTGATIPAPRADAMLRDAATHRMQVLLGSRASKAVRVRISERMPDAATKQDSAIANACLAWRLADLPGPQADSAWSGLLKEVVRLFAFCDDPFVGLFEARESGAIMPVRHAEQALRNSQRLPTAVISLADQSQSALRQASLTPVARRARKEKWESR